MLLFRRPSVLYVRNFVFGVEDSLVSTVGLLSGVAMAGVARQTIFLTGVILIFVEAFSMVVGSFFSELSAEEYEKRGYVPIHKSVAGSIIMFLFLLYFRIHSSVSLYYFQRGIGILDFHIAFNGRSVRTRNY